jgi:hypothetical protein
LNEKFRKQVEIWEKIEIFEMKTLWINNLKESATNIIDQVEEKISGIEDNVEEL